MKKTLILCFMFIIFVFSGCGYKGYSGDYADLYSEAINSVLWNNGHSYSADKKADSKIEIIEKDSYGRTLFTYYEKYYAGAKLSFSALLISQQSSGGNVYYYEDTNYLIKQQDVYSSTILNFTSDEINYLKSINDWDTEIKYGKCIKKEITRNKQKIINEETIKEKTVEKFNLRDREYNLFLDYLTCDKDGNYIVYGSIIKFNGEDIFFVALVKNITNEVEFLVPENPCDYRQEFIKFKTINDWSNYT